MHTLCIPFISVVTGQNTPRVHFKCTDFERCVVVQAYVLQHCLNDHRLNTYMDGWSKLYAVAPPSRTWPPLHLSPQFHAGPTLSYAMSASPAPPSSPDTASAIPFDRPDDPHRRNPIPGRSHMWHPTAQSHTSIHLCCINNQKPDTSAKLLKAFSRA